MSRKIRTGYNIKHEKPKWKQEKEKAEMVDTVVGIIILGVFFALMNNYKSANKSKNNKLGV